MHKNPLRSALMGLALTPILALTACGGGDSGTAPSAPTPAPATESAIEPTPPAPVKEESSTPSLPAVPDETVFDDERARAALKAYCDRLDPEDLTVELNAPKTFVREYGVDDGHAYCTFENPKSISMAQAKTWPGTLLISVEGPASEVEAKDTVVRFPDGGFGTYTATTTTYDSIDLLAVPAGSGYAFRISPRLRYEVDASHNIDGGMARADEVRHQDLAAMVAMTIFGE